MKADILLLRPKGKKTDSRLFAMEQLGLSYIAAVARSNGLSVEIVDGFLEPLRYDEILSTIETDQYHIVGFPIYHETLFRVAKDVATMRNRGLKTHVTVGNYLATLGAAKVLKDFPQFDSAIRGEGEYNLAELAKNVASHADYSLLPGLTYRVGAQIITNPSRPNVEDLDTIPFPARDTLPLVLKAGNAPLLYSSRGCNSRCQFCSVHKFYRASPNGMWRARTPKNVVDEMEQIKSRYGTKEFAFADEQFMGHGQTGVTRALGIADVIIKRRLDCKWYIETRSSDVSLDVFSTLAKAGLRAVFMGIESGYDPALKALKKGIKAWQHVHAIEVLKKLEILPSVGFIMFRPDTSPEELEYNLDFLEEIGCGEITALVTQLKVYAGTDLEESLVSSGQVQGSYLRYQWQFKDSRVKDCFRIAIDSADVLSLSYNQFARIRRLGLLTYDECLELQRAMNSGPIWIMRKLIKAIRANGGATDKIMAEARTQFTEGCEDFLRLLRLTEVIAKNRQVKDGVKLLNPMSLC